MEYYLNQNFEQVLQDHGAMSRFFKQRQLREMEAEEIEDDRRKDMISWLKI